MNNLQSLFSGDISSLFMVGGSILIGIFLFILITLIIPFCLVFKKAGRSWWEALIPFYNLYVLTVIAGQPWWYLIGFFVPFLNYVVGAYIYYHLSKRFGFGIPFTLGLIFLPFIFLPILAFGSAIYTPPETNLPENTTV